MRLLVNFFSQRGTSVVDLEYARLKTNFTLERDLITAAIRKAKTREIRDNERSKRARNLRGVRHFPARILVKISRAYTYTNESLFAGLH